MATSVGSSYPREDSEPEALQCQVEPGRARECHLTHTELATKCDFGLQSGFLISEIREMNLSDLQGA